MGDTNLMAHYAELDETNTVLRILVVHNDVTTIDGVEDEQRGIDFLNGIVPTTGTWVQTSFNGNFRTRYAEVGGTYDPEADEFIDAVVPEETLWPLEGPFPSWILDDDRGWLPPISYPDDAEQGVKEYDWDEATTSWVEVE